MAQNNNANTVIRYTGNGRKSIIAGWARYLRAGGIKKGQSFKLARKLIKHGGFASDFFQLTLEKKKVLLNEKDDQRTLLVYRLSNGNLYVEEKRFYWSYLDDEYSWYSNVFILDLREGRNTMITPWWIKPYDGRYNLI